MNVRVRLTASSRHNGVATMIVLSCTRHGLEATQSRCWSIESPGFLTSRQYAFRSTAYSTAQQQHPTTRGERHYTRPPHKVFSVLQGYGFFFAGSMCWVPAKGARQAQSPHPPSLQPHGLFRANTSQGSRNERPTRHVPKHCVYQLADLLLYTSYSKTVNEGCESWY